MNRACALAVTGLLGALILMPGEAAGQAPARQIPRLPEKTVVKVGAIRGSLTYSGMYVALEKGYFREANIELDWSLGTNIMDLLGLVATGQVDVGSVLPGPAFYNALARGVNFKAVADQFSARPGRSAAAIIVRKDLWDSGKLRDYAQLKGHRVSFNFRGGQFDWMIEEALRRGGLGWDDVNVALIASLPDINVALTNKATDVGVQIEPLVADAVAKGIAVRWKGMDELFPNMQNTFYVFSEGFAAKPDAARAWMVAYVRGLRDYLDAIFGSKADREAVLGMIMKHATVKDRKAYDHVVFPGADPNGAINEKSIREQLTHFVQKGNVKPDAAEKIDFSKVLDPSFVNYAISVLGRQGP